MPKIDLVYSPPPVGEDLSFCRRADGIAARSDCRTFSYLYLMFNYLKALWKHETHLQE